VPLDHAHKLPIRPSNPDNTVWASTDAGFGDHGFLAKGIAF